MTSTASPAIVLYGLPGSHPSAAVERALELKRLRYRRRDRLPVVHRIQHRLLFGQGSAPAIRIGRRRLVGTLEIMGALDSLSPEPAMFPSGDRARDVIEAASWADVELQGVARRLAWAAMVACPQSVESVLLGSKLVLPTGLVLALSRPVILVGARLNRATETQIARDLAALPGLLDRADRLAADGTADADRPNAATLQLAASLALLSRLEDIQPMLEGRPAVKFAADHFPHYPGRFRAGCVPRASSSAVPGTRYDGGPEEGSRGSGR